ncbi:MAG: hypothetical protein IJ807_06500 [Eubacterium sp.]|nr:hypothetical protein [Eubacterium sp.]
MKDLYKRFISAIVLLGAILLIAQLAYAFINTFINLDSMVTSTATSLLSSTNREITENANQRFDRMIRVGSQIAEDDDFRSYSRTETTLPAAEIARKELALGQVLARLSTLDNFCDCCIIFKDDSYLGQIDATTMELFSKTSLYKTFSDVSDRDSENFLTGHDQDYTRLYYSKVVNSSTIALISILREELEPIFFDAEENYNLTLHMSTPEHDIIYSGDSEETSNGSLDTDLAQAVENSNHISTTLRDTIIASDTCINGWRITTTIPESTLTSENATLRTIYIIVSLLISTLSVVVIFFLCRHIKRRTEELEKLSEDIDEYSDLKNLNID